MCDVLWCYTDANGAAVVWAALVAAIPAVIAVYFAYRIGQRQLNILNAQVNLQAEASGQALAIEDLKVRTDLFDKRMEVYKATQAFVSVILTDGDPPSFKRTGTAEEQARQQGIARDFQDAVERSRYLFGRDVHDRLFEGVWDAANRLHYHLVSQENPRPEDETNHPQAVLDLRKHFIHFDLDALMGDKLGLY